MVPVLAGFIAFSIADRPWLTSDLIGGMIAGFIAGYVAKLLSSKVKLPQKWSGLTSWLANMGTANAVLLGAILGGMNVYRDYGWSGEQSGLCVWCRSAELADLSIMSLTMLVARCKFNKGH